jgi:hypothetical protein
MENVYAQPVNTRKLGFNRALWCLHLQVKGHKGKSDAGERKVKVKEPAPSVPLVGKGTANRRADSRREGPDETEDTLEDTTFRERDKVGHNDLS